jgi:hypothetical protein
MRCYLVCLLVLAGCGSSTAQPQPQPKGCEPVDGFDFPVGPPDAVGYRDATPFKEDDHLGSDWNGLGGGNTDLGDPVYSAADGVVTFSSDEGGGWGKVVRIASCVQGNQEVEALYAHFETVTVTKGMRVKRGQQIGTIGTANGQYLAHLHFEMREKPGLPLGGGYSKDTTGYLDPTAFVKAHRPQR